MAENLSLFKKSETHLFFDTETTGLPFNNLWSAPATALNVWPRMVQIAWEYYKDGQLESTANYIIRPEGFSIPADTAAVHGITTERAMKEGTDLGSVLQEFKRLASKADFLVAHNISFDEKVVGAELLRKGLENIIPSRKLICTKELSTNFCAIPHDNGRAGYKWPKLAELHWKLFGEDFVDAHNAMADVKATARCFFALKKLGVA